MTTQNSQTKPFILRNPETISYEELQHKITIIPNKKTKALCCLLYASGCRVSEALQIKRQDLYFRTIKDKEYLVIRAPILKKGKSVSLPFRQALVSMEEEWLVVPILEHADPLTEDALLFPIDRSTAYRYVMRFVGFNPHGFRKLRATHLAVKYKFTDQQLVRFFGWSNSMPASIYTKLNVEDIAY